MGFFTEDNGRDFADGMRDIQYEQDTEDTVQFFVMFFLAIAVGIVAVVAGSSWIDHQTGWHLHGWLTDHFTFLKKMHS